MWTVQAPHDRVLRLSCRFFILLDATIPIRFVNIRTVIIHFNIVRSVAGSGEGIAVCCSCSLYVTLELVKLIQCMYAAADRHMYDAASDTPFVYKTTTLNEVKECATSRFEVIVSCVMQDLPTYYQHVSVTHAGPGTGRVCAF